MEFRSVGQLSADIVTWSESLPRDVDLIVGVPRSGMLAATLLALHLDKPLVDVQGYVQGRVFQSGNRGRDRHHSGPGHALVVDDTVRSGGTMREVRALVDSACKPGTSVSYGAVYIAPGTPPGTVDYWHSAVPTPRVFEWNVLHHDRLRDACMDIDGVLCRDPRDDENDDGACYDAFLRIVPARLVPAVEVGWLVTSRLERYRSETEAWLAEQEIRYRELIMHPAATAAERRAGKDHAVRKAAVYRRTNGWLFIESDRAQAAEIARLAGRPVYCSDTREMIQPSPVAALSAEIRRAPRVVLRKVKRRVGWLPPVARWRAA